MARTIFQKKIVIDNNEKYKIEIISDSKIYSREPERYLLDLYYLAFKKNNLKEEINLELVLAI